MCFDDEEKLIVTATMTPFSDSKSLVYTKDEKNFDLLFQNAQRQMNGSGTPGPNTTGWAEITEEIFLQVKEEVKAFMAGI